VTLHPFSENDVTDTDSLPKVDKLPVLTRDVSASYPEQMLTDRILGEVELSFLVTKTGNVEDIRVLKSTDISFAKSAKEAVADRQYLPASSEGHPVECRMHLLMKFTPY